MGDDDRIRPARKSSVTPAGVWTTYGAQNLPAVLNDPQKGKQRDFFTRSWGVEFTETSPLPLVQPSAGVTDSINRTHFERYLKRVRKYGSSSRRDPLLKSSGTSSRASPIEDAASPVHARAVRINDTSHIPAPFLDQNLSLSKRDTFERIFPFIKEGSRPGSPTFNERMMMSGRLIQEKLTHHLDHVEVDIAKQVAQKSHHFFEVMTSHDTLMNQLSILITLIHHLRSKLQGVNSSAFKMFLKVCQLRRRQQNARCVQEKLGLMSSIHQTQPTIQVLLASSEFSGALDLITTSRDILAVDLKNIVSFRHLSPQLQEIHSVIGRMLLADFKTYISMQIGQDNVHIKASELTSTSYYQDIDSDQLHCVIQGLIRQRQDSYEFLEKFEEASIMSVKRVIKEVSLSQFSETDSTVVAEFAKRANSQEWITFMDVLIGVITLANGDSYCMTDSIPDFLIILSEYCNLCDKLTSTGQELGVKAAELITFFNSRVCQLVLGAGAITTSGLKTITIRNLALVLRNLQLVEKFIPRIFDHFSARMAPPGETSAKPAVDSLCRQFDHSKSNVSNHVEMIQQKVTDVVEAILKQHLSTWQPHNQVPSTNFKALCKQLTKLHESVSDIWPEEKIRILFDKVHGLFLSLVQSEIHLRGLNTSSASRPTSKAASKQLQDRETTKRALLSELVFYGQSMIRLDIIDAEKLQREEFEQLWT